MGTYFEIQRCEVCRSTNLKSVLDLGKQPMCDDLIPVGNTAKCEMFPIKILYCSQCGTAHQKYQIPKVHLFPQTYHYRSRFTTDVLSGMEDLVRSVETKAGSLAGLSVLDIGCNDGSLLDKFSAKGATTIGVEPTGAYTDAEGRGHLIINDFFSESIAQEILSTHSSIDVITFTNVFAHIEDLPALLKALSFLISEETILVIENHYLGAVLDRNQFDTFYHEHPRTYSLNSFVHIARTLGREVIAVEFPSRYGGNIRVIIGKPGTATSAMNILIKSVLEQETNFFEQFSQMRFFITAWKQNKKAEIQALVKTNGKILAKAFPGRAAILFRLLELSNDEVECVYEKPGSPKIGHYVPGTRVPIMSDEALFPRFPKTQVVLNLAWHIPVEIETYLRGHGFKGQLVHIV